jgi:hypothetical protein
MFSNIEPRKKLIAWESGGSSCTYLLTYLLNFSLTPYSTVLLEKLTDLPPVKKFPEFYGTRRFITAFTSARHLSLSWGSWIQSIPPHPTSWNSALILSSHLRLGLPSGLFPSGFHTKTLYTSLPTPIRAPCPAHLILLDFITRTLVGEQHIMKLIIMKFSPLPCYLVPLRPKYSPQQPILKHPGSSCFLTKLCPLVSSAPVHFNCYVLDGVYSDTGTGWPFYRPPERARFIA